MANPSYEPCPGGVGKKIKFCCPDLVNDLTKIDRMTRGGQYQGCFDFACKLDEKYPGRACLVTIKAQLAERLGLPSVAQTALETFLVDNPDNPVALAEAALAASVNEQDARRGVEPLQRALALCGADVPQRVLDVLTEIAKSLAEEGFPYASRMHFMLRLRQRPEDSRASMGYLAVSRESHFSLLLRDGIPYSEAPQDAPWKADFDQAMEQAGKGLWSKAAEKLVALTQRFSGSAAIWRNLAILRMSLADNAGAARAWRRHATLEPRFEFATLAEAYAQALEFETVDLVDYVKITRRISDWDALVTRLKQSPLLVSSSLDHLDAVDQPKPKFLFTQFDIPLADENEILTIDNVPTGLGTVCLYSRETDREPRLELLTWYPLSESARESLDRIAGDALGETIEEVSILQSPARDRLFDFRIALPSSVPMDRKEDFTFEKRRSLMLGSWPEIPSTILDDLPPREAAKDEKFRIRLAAMILCWECELDSDELAESFDELRRTLGVPPPPSEWPVETTKSGVFTLARANFAEMNDDDLIGKFAIAMSFGAAAAITRIARELVKRPAIANQEGITEIWLHLHSRAESSRESYHAAQEGRNVALRTGVACQEWDFRVLELSLQRGDSAQFADVMKHLQLYHAKEPQVRQALWEFLVTIGVIHPDGTPVHRETDAGPTSSESKGKLWTPGDPVTAPAAPAASPGAIWTPGME